MEIWHVTIPAVGRHALFPTEEGRRRAVRALARVAGRSLALFCVVDEHVHLVVVRSRARAGRLAQAVGRALGHLAATPLAAAHFQAVRDRRHLEALVGYVLGQPARHGLPGHAALWTGSSYLDLHGARALPGLVLRLHEVLPRLGIRRIGDSIGLCDIEPRLVTLEEIREMGASRLVAAASAALAAPPDLAGNEPATRSARASIVRLALEESVRNEFVTIAPRQPEPEPHREEE